MAASDPTAGIAGWSVLVTGGGSGIGLILIICLVIYCFGGLRTKS